MQQGDQPTGSALDIRGDLGLASAMRIVGSQGEDEACREEVLSGDASQGSAANERGDSQNPVHSGESEANERVQKPNGGTETAGLRHDQHEARSSRRVGIVCAPRNYKRPQSLQDLKSSGGQRYSATQGGTNTTSPPAIPPRSPLRPRPRHQPSLPTLVGTTPQATSFNPLVSKDDEAQLILMPSLRESFGGSLSVLLATLEAETLQDKALPLPPDLDDDFTIDYSDEIDDDYGPDQSLPSSTDSFTLEIPTSPVPGPITPSQPTIMTKRVHALRELLSSERAYASDLALIRDIHIPLALGRSPLL